MSKALNELKKATMASYLSKAGGRIRSATKIAGDFEADHYKAMATANKHHPNMVTPGFEKDPEKLKKAETKMKVTGDLRDTFKRDAYNRIKGIARAGRLLAKEDTINERNTESHPSLWDTHELRHESGKALKKGDKVKGFRGTYKIQGFEMPHHSGSTGRVYTDKGSFFPDIVNAEIVKKSVSEETLDEVNLVKKIKRGLAGWGAFDKDSPRELVNRHKAYDTQTLKNLKTNKKTGKGSPAELQQKVIKRELKKRVGLEESEQVNEVSRSTIAKVAQARFNQAQKALKDKNYPEYVKKMQKAIKAGDATVPKTGWSPEDDNVVKREEFELSEGQILFPKRGPIHKMVVQALKDNGVPHTNDLRDDGSASVKWKSEHQRKAKKALDFWYNMNKEGVEVSAQEKYRQIRESKMRNRKGK